MPCRKAPKATTTVTIEHSITVDSSNINPALLVLADAATTQASLLIDSSTDPSEGTTLATLLIILDASPGKNLAPQAPELVEKFGWSLSIHTALLETLCD